MSRSRIAGSSAMRKGDGQLLNLISADLIILEGEPVFTFKGIAGLDPRTLKDQQVMIDGHPYDVLGVDTYCVVDPSGLNFGLMVKRAG